MNASPKIPAPQLQSALAELRRAGAKGLPTVDQVQTAPNGKDWHGPNDTWELIKNSNDSYNVRC